MNRKDVKITTYFDQHSAQKLMEEAERTTLPAAALIRFHTIRSLNNPSDECLTGQAGRNVRTRLGLESR